MCTEVKALAKIYYFCDRILKVKILIQCTLVQGLLHQNYLTS